MSARNEINLSLQTLKEIESFCPELGRFPSRMLVDSYGDFIELLYRDIDDIVFDLTKNPELRRKDSEDRLTIELVCLLRRLQYNASHDAKIGGHTDISIEKSQYLWIGEAKIFSGSYDWLLKGFHQLTTRYSIGNLQQNHGALIIYIQSHNSIQVMQKWKRKLQEKEPNIKIEECSLNQECFVSISKHPRSGANFYVRHIPVSLLFDPQDK